jgi:RNA polymerase sigma factor (sigma-70 family)
MTVTTTPSLEQYATELRIALRNRLRNNRHLDVDDVVASVLARFAANAQAIAEAYPEPRAYARATAYHAMVAYERAERAQRGAGCRLFQVRDAQAHPEAPVALAPGRAVVSGNVTVGSDPDAPQLFDTLAATAGAVDDEVVDRLDISACLREYLASVKPIERAGLWLVYGHGYSVTEAAAALGCARETLSRRLNRLEPPASRRAACARPRARRA